MKSGVHMKDELNTNCSDSMFGLFRTLTETDPRQKRHNPRTAIKLAKSTSELPT
jgi:hypothetical protein